VAKRAPPMRSVQVIALVCIGLATSLCGCKGSEIVQMEAGVDSGPPPVVTVAMNANDPSGSGANTEEVQLDVENVAGSAFGRLFVRSVDGDQSAQPLYAGGLTFADGSKKNVVYVATSHDSVYAFDADEASASEPIWHVSVGESIPLPNPWFGRKTVKSECKANAVAPFREAGITATPVLDRATLTLYVLALEEDDTQMIPDQTCLGADPKAANYCMTYSCSTPTIEYRLHALDMLTGAEKPGSPVVVEGSVAGKGSLSKDGIVPFNTPQAFARTGLLLAFGNVYFATASYGDIEPYHGWTFAYDATTLKQVGVFCDTPGGSQGGIWQSGRSLLSDGTSLYVITGNGTFDVNNGGTDYGDSALRLDPTLHDVLDYFSPFFSDYDGVNILEKIDSDLGAAGALLIPNTTLMLASGKSGTGYVIDTGNMGKFHETGDQIAQEIRLTWHPTKKSCGDKVPGSEVHGSPTYWQGPDGLHVFVWGAGDYLRDYLLDANGRFSSKGICFCKAPYTYLTGNEVSVSDPPCGVTQSENNETGGQTGGITSVSSNGARSGTGIVWASYSSDGMTNPTRTTGTLQAYDATDVTTAIWSSKSDAAAHGSWSWAKYTPPTIANGKVYLPTFSKELIVYGLAK
jgi:hypothetical protein